MNNKIENTKRDMKEECISLNDVETAPAGPGGNCAPLEAHGVNVDSWRSFGTPRTLAWPGLDPSADPVAQR